MAFAIGGEIEHRQAIAHQSHVFVELGLDDGAAWRLVALIRILRHLPLPSSVVKLATGERAPALVRALSDGGCLVVTTVAFDKKDTSGNPQDAATVTLTITRLADTDADGLPDTWEDQHQLTGSARAAVTAGSGTASGSGGGPTITRGLPAGPAVRGIRESLGDQPIAYTDMLRPPLPPRPPPKISPKISEKSKPCPPP